MSLLFHRLEPAFAGVSAGYLEPLFQVIELGIPLIALGMMLLYYYGLNGWGMKAWDKTWHWVLGLLLAGALSATLTGIKTQDAVVKGIVTDRVEDPTFFDQQANQAALDSFQLQAVLLGFGLGALLFIAFSLAGKGGSRHAWHVPVKWPHK